MGSYMSSSSEFYPHKMEYQCVENGDTNARGSRRLHDKIGIFAFLFILFFLIIVCFSSSSNRNNPDVNVDYLGHICGRDYSTVDGFDLRKKPYLYYANFQDYSGSDNKLVAICVSMCPTGQDTDEVCKYSSFADCYKTYNTYQIGKICMPGPSEVYSADQVDVYMRAIYGQVSDSIKQKWYIAVASILISMACGIIWLQIVHHLPRFAVYLSVLAYMLTSIAFMVFCWVVKSRIDQLPKSYCSTTGNCDVLRSFMTNKSFTCIQYLLLVLDVLAVLYLWLYRKELPFIAAVSKISGERLDKLYHKFCALSFVNLIFIPACIAYLAFSLLYNSLYDHFELFGVSIDSKSVIAIQVLVLLFCIWCINYFSDIFTTTTASVFSEWYWSHREQGEASHPIMQSVWNVSNNHMGNITIGSIYLTITTFFLACVHFIVSTINHITYIMSTITGSTYFSSFLEALRVIFKNIEILYCFFIGFQVSTVGLVSTYLSSATISWICFYPLLGTAENLYLIVFTLVAQFIVCFIVIYIYAVGFNTLLFSFFYEKSMSHLHAEPMHCCPEGLVKFADVHIDSALEALPPSTA